MCCLFVPETARVISFTACSFISFKNSTATFCECMVSNIPADVNQTSFPNRHKEIVQQTEWQYLTAERVQMKPSFLLLQKKVYNQFNNRCTSFYLNSIFHPPCFS